MNLLPTPDQGQIVEAVAAFMSEQLPVSRYRTLPPGADSLSMSRLVQIAEMGWLGLGLDELHGGSGSPLSDEALMLREVGRQAGPVSIYASVMAARVAALADLPELATRIVQGTVQVQVAAPVGDRLKSGP